MAGKGAPLCPLVSAVLARGVCAVIPLFFYAAEIAAAKMLLFFAGIGEDGYFDHTRVKGAPALQLQPANP